MVRSAWLPIVVALVASCRSTPAAAPAPAASADLDLRLGALEQRLALLERLLAGRDAAPMSTTPLAADSVERVSRVEQRLDKVVGFLKQAVRPEVDTSQMYALPIDANDPSVGPADAPVTIVEASEYLCPYCNMLEPTIDRLRGEYPKTVRVVSKYLVIHGPPAVPAGLGACAAGRQGKFEQYKAKTWAAIWPKPDDPQRDQAEASAIESRAKAIGLDLKRYQADVADGGPCETWMATTSSTLDTFGVSGTPTIFVNGRLADDRDYASLKSRIDMELAAVKSSGVPAARYYRDVVMAKGRAAAVMVSPFD